MEAQPRFNSQVEPKTHESVSILDNGCSSSTFNFPFPSLCPILFFPTFDYKNMIILYFYSSFMHWMLRTMTIFIYLDQEPSPVIKDTSYLAGGGG